MRALIWVSFLLVFRAFASSPSTFVFVMIDSQTEAQYGTLPFNRAVIAKAIDKLAAAGAKGIILKFFYDLPSTEDRDRALESSICAAPIALQASLNDTEGTTNGLDARFRIDNISPEGFPPAFSGDKGLIPLARFSRCARAVGFVDVGYVNSVAADIPLLEVYQGKVVKSLHLVALEMAYDHTAQIQPSGTIRLGEKELDIMHHIDFPPTNSLAYIPLHVVVNDTAKGWQIKVQQSVVIIGYVGKKIHSIQTPMGPLSAHRFFIAGLMSLSKSMQEKGQVVH
jgi:hypothetical protein